MVTLQTLTQLQDGRFYAKWYDADDNCPELGHTVAALHDGNGRPEAVNLGLYVPRLTAEQMAAAQPDQHRAYDLAARGTAAKPEWADRYQKAAELVESGSVRLTGPETAVVTSSEEYTVTSVCQCKWAKIGRGGPCSHIIAVRMARALHQTAEPLTEAEKEARGAARRQANRDAKERRIASRGENIAERNRRQARRDGDGARQYWRMAYANGTMTVSPEIAQRAR